MLLVHLCSINFTILQVEPQNGIRCFDFRLQGLAHEHLDMIQALTKKKFIVSMQKEASIVTLLALELKDSGEVLEIWRKKTNSKGTILDIKTNGGRILLSKSSDSGNSLVMELSPETGETIRTYIEFVPVL